jgi:hypothetical protein
VFEPSYLRAGANWRNLFLTAPDALGAPYIAGKLNVMIVSVFIGTYPIIIIIIWLLYMYCGLCRFDWTVATVEVSAYFS